MARFQTPLREIIGFATLVILLPELLLLTKAAESTPGCGKIDKALLGRDPRVAAPWTATILYQSNFKCGEFRQSGFGHGVIIGPTTILMSGKFLWTETSNFDNSRLLSFKPSNFVVAVGLKSRQPFSADQYTQFLKVSYFRLHDKSFKRYSENDIVLVHLVNPIRYSSYVRPICLDNSPDVAITDVNSTYKLGDLSISGFNRGHPDTEPFGFLDESICSTKLTKEYQDAAPSADLGKLKLPCGFSSKSREDVQSWSGYGNGLIQSRFLDIAQIAKLRPDPVLTNLCYQKGSSITTFYNDRWYLIGVVAESLGTSCKSNNVYFISFATHKENIDWIMQNIWFSTSSFVCNDGQTVELSKLCNDFNDCNDDSDENEKYCTAIKCGTIFSSFCTKCDMKENIHILGKSYTYSNSNSSDEVKCPALKQPQGSLLHCENPIIRKRITCAYGSDPGTKAVFQCKTGKPSEPSSYCVVTCKDDGTWTDELKSYICKSNSSTGNSGKYDQQPRAATDLISHKKESWLDKLLLTNHENAGVDTSLENWSPPPLSPDIGDKSAINTCPGFRKQSGLKITCRVPGSPFVSTCSNSVPAGTKAEFGCERYYRPIFSAASVIKTCQSNGRWSLENRAFECRLDCGVPKQDLVGHIVNGQITSGTKWPWHGVLFRKNKGQLAYICGATLISKNLLITAAHCVTSRNGDALPPEDFVAILGATSNELSENSGDPNSQIVTLNNITVNQAFNPTTFESDIALIRLSKHANISDFVRPACFPSTFTQHNELLHLSPGSNGFIIGYGYDESGNPSRKMREAVLPVVSYSDCYNVVKVQASSSMYCAGYTNGTAACNGDSGGGMFFQDDTYPRRMYLQGIVSHGNRDEITGLCDKNQYSIFTKVSAFKNWINEIGYYLDEDF